MPADGNSVALVAWGVVPNLVAEHGNVEVVVKEFLSNLEVDVHREWYFEKVVHRLGVVANETPEQYVVGKLWTPIVDIAVDVEILVGVVADGQALVGSEPLALCRD